MVTFKFENNYYTAYKNKEVGNPHIKGYPCLVDLNQEIIPNGKQKAVLRGLFESKGLDYHEVIHYQEKDINTHDLIGALIKFHEMKRI